MSSHVINDDEWSALFYESSDAYKVYSGLRRVMDYKAGVAGLTYRINEAFFKELLEVESIPGRGVPEKITREKVRSILRRLEKIGLITHRGQFVFKLNLATVNNSVQNSNNRTTTKATTKAATHQQPDKSQSNQSGYEDKQGEQKPEHDTTHSVSNNPPQVSGNIDRYTGRQQLHDALKIVVPEKWLIRSDDRKLMGEWLKMGIGSNILNEAIERAMQAKQGESFGVRYLDPVVRQLKQKTVTPEKNDVTRKAVRKCSADKNQAAADDYLRSHGINEQGAPESSVRVIDGEVVG